MAVHFYYGLNNCATKSIRINTERYYKTDVFSCSSLDVVLGGAAAPLW